MLKRALSTLSKGNGSNLEKASKNASSSFTNKIIPQPQSPNHAATWSASQNPKSLATTGPRFEQTNWDLQPNPLSAQELIAKVPIKKVEGRKVACDGGGGSLGHPKVYLNLDGKGATCGYCGLRFEQDHSHHH